VAGMLPFQLPGRRAVPPRMPAFDPLLPLSLNRRWSWSEAR